jgi:hypothetical protein
MVHVKLIIPKRVTLKNALNRVRQSFGSDVMTVLVPFPGEQVDPMRIEITLPPELEHMESITNGEATITEIDFHKLEIIKK